jgi:5,10-methylenetetrahydromethanopterin reductase
VQLAISIGISPRQTLAGWAEFAAELEAEGVDRLWLIDSQLAMKDVYAGLYLAALRTRSMQLGTGVTNPLTRHPTVTANAFAALDELSNGRALLGVGAGDSAVYGIGWKPAKVAQVEDALAFFRSVLSGAEGTLAGRAYRLPALGGRVPIWLAASQRRMCRLAGRLCDGVILMGPAEPTFVSQQVAWVEQGLGEAGRSRSSIEISLMTTLSVGADRQAALDDVRSWASTEARLIADFAEFPPGLEGFRSEIEAAKAAYNYSEHLSTHAGHRSQVSDDLTQALAVAGTVEVAAARVRELLACGIDNCIFPLLGGGRLERLRMLRDHLMPAVATA